MGNLTIPKKQWKKIFTFLKQEQQKRTVYIKDEQTCKLFLEAVLWIARSGAQWRLLPEKHGRWNSIYKRFAQWEKQGVFKRMSDYFAKDHDLESLMLDSTIVRAHMCAAGALKKTVAKNNKRSDVLEAVLVPRFMYWSIPMASL